MLARTTPLGPLMYSTSMFPILFLNVRLRKSVLLEYDADLQNIVLENPHVLSGY